MRGFPQYFEWLGIFLGGGLGAICRYGLNLMVARITWLNLPHAGILMVNLLGCFAMGICVSSIPNGGLRNMISAGFLGGFTTYATFAWLLSDLWSDQRYLFALVQLFVHLGGGLLFLIAGVVFGHSLAR